MSVLLGIDTGGTYTDAVLLDDERGIIGAAKALTTKHDLSEGIQNAVKAALPDSPPQIQLVSLSSTLATNAIVEGKGSPICLILIGYDPEILDLAELRRVVTNEALIFIQGGHTVTGEEQAPLDIAAARRAIETYARSVAAFAISGYFSVHNPTHELRVKRLVRRLTGLPVTCGHELTTNLHAPRRALTAALNARLTPLLQQLILSVSQMLVSQGIHAPLMVVRGDGSLMNAEMALERPVETILSGPAASVVGAHYLSNTGDAFVIDMGGTTTDIAALHNGHPTVNREGAWMDNWQTMVEAINVRTTGLGGDSEIRLAKKNKLCVGPRRMIPLSLLAQQYPEVIDVLHGQLERGIDRDAVNKCVGYFLLRGQPPKIEQSDIISAQQEILSLLNDGPFPMSRLLSGAKYPLASRRHVDELMEYGLVVASAFTPTDAVHVLGQYRCGSLEAAELGATLWAHRLGISSREFCERVVRQVIAQAGRAVIESALTEEDNLALESGDSVGHLFIERALGTDDGGSFLVTFSMRRSLVGIGAPATTYLPPVAAQLHTHLCIPKHAEVANAIGAVAGRVIQTVRILIRPMEGENAFRVHLPFGVRDFKRLADAVACAKQNARRLARDRAHWAGASTVKVHTEQHERSALIGGESGGKIFIDTEVTATAVGSPQPRE
jgi:N-methylhydantoinase A/oxoprolinase/acetone carboxylase beta subunit